MVSPGLSYSAVVSIGPPFLTVLLLARHPEVTCETTHRACRIEIGMVQSCAAEALTVIYSGWLHDNTLHT
jgi:hypothetical protein